MIPIKIQIKNFVSYGPQTQTIEFEPYHLICLSGKNGHGKSALLDALTWAVWGQARKSSASAKPDEGLLRLGETSMMVCLDFSVGGQTYRVRREFLNAGKKNQAQLEFGIFEHENLIRPLTDKTIKATQEKIEKTIGLDYETFINSAFLRQGQSNEFSKKSPKERKEILATILGLNEFETLKKLASDKARHASQQKEYNVQSIEHIKKELEGVHAVDHQLALLNQAIGEFDQKEAELKTRQAACILELVQLQEPKSKLDLLVRKIEQLSAVIAQQTQSVLTETQQARTLIKQKRSMAAPDLVNKQLNEAQIALATAQLAQQKKFACKETMITLKEQLNHITTELEKSNMLEKEQLTKLLTHAQMHYLAVEQRAKHLDQQIQTGAADISKISNAITDTLKKHTNLGSPAQDNVLQEAQFDKRKEYYHKWIARIQFLKNELIQLEQKKLIIHQKESASCPVCKQDLSSVHKNQITQDLAHDEKRITHHINRLTHIAGALKAKLIEQHAYLEMVKKTVHEQAQLSTQLQEYTKQREQLEKTHETYSLEKTTIAQEVQNAQQTILECEKKSKEHMRIAQQMVDEHPERIRIIALVNQHATDLERLEKETDNLQALTHTVKQLEEQKQHHMEALRQIALLDERKNRISSTIKAIKELKKHRHEIELERGALDWCLEKEPVLIEQRESIQNMYSHMSAQKEKYMMQKGGLDQQKIYFVQKETVLKENQAQIAQLDQSIEDFKAISVALSKDGIQALLIEDVIPEIESEANALLSKLTDNQAHLTIESLRDTKSGTTKETLDIKISDAVGIRPYELFSGGEAFRIDFSLRIAISKLLAKRAGTSLQTLIIDEGFGSQDEEGLEHIMQALYKIQEDFSKVIVVSHLASMKEQFPVHFHISKGPQGSLVKVIHNG